MTGWLEGTVALVTGAGNGLGAAITERFVAEGARVAAVDRDLAAAQQVAARCPDGSVLPLAADVRDAEQVGAAVQECVSSFGGLDTLVTNAGIWDYQRGLTKLSADQLSAAFDEVMGVNVKGYLIAAHAAWPHLVRSRGSIVMTLSNASFHTNGGGPVYTASKHACLGLMRELAYELAPHVRVNGVACGGMRTSLSGPQSLALDGRSIADSFDRAAEAGHQPTIPLHDTSVEPADFTGGFVFLASRANSGVITGVAVPADGGIAVRGFRTPAGGDDLPERLPTT